MNEEELESHLQIYRWAYDCLKYYKIYELYGFAKELILNLGDSDKEHFLTFYDSDIETLEEFREGTNSDDIIYDLITDLGKEQLLEVLKEYDYLEGCEEDFIKETREYCLEENIEFLEPPKIVWKDPNQLEFNFSI